MISDETQEICNRYLRDMENKAIVNEKYKQLEELKQENELLEKIIDLMALDIYKFSKGYCNTSIREKDYINEESVKLEYIRLAKEKMQNV